MNKLALALLIVILAAPVSMAQEKSKEKKEEPKKMKFDFEYRYDPRELHEYSRLYDRWRRIKGIFGIGTYHVHVGHDIGPNNAPPLRIWGQGFGTSLWRDPVTGRPIM